MTKRMMQTGKVEEVTDEWSLFADKEEKFDWWRGISEFDVDTYLISQGPPAIGWKEERRRRSVRPRNPRT